MDSNHATFTYSRLKEELKEIRLLDIQFAETGSHDDTDHGHLECHIRHVSLSANPKPDYETVSYCWGDPTPSEAIQVDGQVLMIPIETHEVLLRLASPKQTRSIWIDAICIDQTNTQERSQQVALMGGIYRYGTINQIYLGDEHPLAARALHNIDAIHKDFAEVLQEGQEWMDLIISLTPDHDILRASIDVEALVYLYSCKWFT